ncbi:MAG: glycosyltransferase family 4 protein [Candidatus Hodarchaeota archaeon]
MVRIVVLSAIPVSNLPPKAQDFVFWNLIEEELGYLMKFSKYSGMVLTSPTIKTIQFGEINLAGRSRVHLCLIPKYSQVRTHKTGKLSLLWNLIMDFIFLILHVLCSLIIIIKSRANAILDISIYLSSFSAVLVSFLLRKPLITWKRGNPIKNAMLHSLSKNSILSNILLRLYAIIEVISVRRSALVICDSFETIHMFEKYVTGRIVYLPNCVDLKRFDHDNNERQLLRKHLGFTVNDFVLLYAGRLEIGKGIRPLIEAVHIFEDHFPRFQLLIAGSGTLEQELRSLVSNYGIQDRVRFLGSVPYDKMPRLIHASDCVVLLSSAEGTPRILLEALACGKPIIASNVGGIAEMFAKNLNIGEQVMDATPQNIILAFQKIAIGEQDTTRKAKNAILRRNFVAKHYSLQIIGKKFVRYIQAVISSFLPR